MVDGISAAGLTIESLCLTIKCIKLLKHYAETVKNARKELQSIISKAERLKNIFELIRITMLELKNTKLEGMDLELNYGSFRSDMNELLSLIRSMYDEHGKMGFWNKLNFAKKKTQIEAIVTKIQALESQAMNLVIIVNTRFSLRTERTLHEFTQTANKTADLHVAFTDLYITEDGVSIEATFDRPTRIRRTWLGQVNMESQTQEYNDMRHTLANHAYYGDWQSLWDSLRMGSKTFGENWVNAVRPRELENIHRMSFYTPLHQMVYNRASALEVKQLLDMGASRVLRTRHQTEFQDQDMTPLDLAHELELTYLYDLLTPIIRSPLPQATLSTLQSRFHDLIRRDLGDFVDNEKLFLPEVEVLTEIRAEEMWFPIRKDGITAAYAYMLDGRELLVKRVNLPNKGDESYVRISQHETYQIEEPLFFAESVSEQDTDDI